MQSMLRAFVRAGVAAAMLATIGCRTVGTAGHSAGRAAGDAAEAAGHAAGTAARGAGEIVHDTANQADRDLH